MALRFEGDKMNKQQLEDLIARLHAARTSVARGEIRKAMEFVVKTSIDLARLYPPEIPGSHYVRTRRLADGWHGDVVGGGKFTVGFIRNPVEYSPLVMQRGKQIAIHVGRWNEIEEIVEAVGAAPFEVAAMNIALSIG